MRIALVGHDFDFSAGDGISRYSNELFKGLGRLPSRRANRITTYTEKGFARRFLSLRVDGDLAHLMYPTTIAVRARLPQVLTWHDDQPLLRYTRFKSMVVSHLVRTNFSNADGIIAVSSKAAGQASRYAAEHTWRDKPIRMIPEGLNEMFIRERPPHGVEREDFVYVGSVHFTHKNFDTLVYTFGRLLEMLGRRRKGMPRLHVFTPTEKGRADAILNDAVSVANLSRGAKKALRGSIVMHYGESDAKVLRQMERSVALLHLSTKEGFGFPILEAQAVGTQAIVLKGADIPVETTKYAVKGQGESIVEAAYDLFRSPRPASAEAVRYAKSFTWDRNVVETERFYRSVLGV